MIVLLSAILPLLLAVLASLVFRSYAKCLLKIGTATALLWFWLNACGALNALYGRLLVPVPWPTRVQQPIAVPGQTIRLVLLGGGTELTGPNLAPMPAGDAIEKLVLTAVAYEEATALGYRVEVIISGGDPEKHGVTEADNYAPDLVSLGVPASVIVKENRSLNTFQNAQFVAKILATQHVTAHTTAHSPPLILLTTAIHMRRSLLDFQRQGLLPSPMAPPLHTLQQGWWPTVLRLAQAEADLHELIGVAQFHVYRQIGWY